MKTLEYKSTRLVPWKDPRLPVNIVVKMECENHEEVSGNKWWKLKHNLRAAYDAHLPILTFGGAYSNHIYATSAAARSLGLDSIGIIRGERVTNHVLSFAEKNGMRLEFVSRDVYRNKTDESFLDQLRGKYGKFYLVPEGGTNELAIQGCRELGEMLEREIKFDTLCLAVGTGGTMAGIISALIETKNVIGYSVLKGGNFLERDVAHWLTGETCEWKIETNYHFGGYAKTTPELMDFIAETRRLQGISLDPVYTAKAMFGVLDMAQKGLFVPGSTILFVHTGGLQATAS